MSERADSQDQMANSTGRSDTGSCLSDLIDPIMSRLERIESSLDLLVRQRTIKDFYSTAEIAEILGKAEFTVREWCRLGRINAQKKFHGRGAFTEWVVARAEQERFQREGLLPRK